MISKTTTCSLSAAAVLALAIGLGCQKNQRAMTASLDDGPPNNSYVTFSGTIIEAGPDAFRVDYGGGTFLVEMDDFDDMQEGYTLKEGDEVVVYGFVDNEMHEQRSIEAGSVYVRSLDTQFYASSVDEEDYPDARSSSTNATGAEVSLTGYVTSLAGNLMTLETNQIEVTVDLSTLERNVIDQVGYQQLSVGDQVYVKGLWSEGPRGTLEIEADTLTTVMEAEG